MALFVYIVYEVLVGLAAATASEADNGQANPTKDNMIIVAGEVTTHTKIDYDKIVRGVAAKIGFDSCVDEEKMQEHHRWKR